MKKTTKFYYKLVNRKINGKFAVEIVNKWNFKIVNSRRNIVNIYKGLRYDKVTNLSKTKSFSMQANPPCYCSKLQTFRLKIITVNLYTTIIVMNS